MRFGFLFLFITASFVLKAQENVYFRHLTNGDGLPCNFVGSILQDHEGYMWFGTSEGLSRYDGYSFYNLRNSPTDSSSLIHNNIRCLLEDSHHNLWIGTQKGLTYLDLNTYKFKRFTARFKDQIGSTWITAFCLIDNDHLLVTTFTQGFYILDINREVIQSFKHEGNNGPVSNTIREVMKDRSNQIWLATDHGLDKFDPVSHSFIHLLPGKDIQRVCMDSQGNLLVPTLGDAVIFKVNPLQCSLIGKEDLPPDSKDKPKSIFFDRSGKQWIAITDGGILCKDLKTNQETRLLYNKYLPNGINSNAPVVIYGDATGNIWIGTFDSGINLLEKYRKPFIQIKDNFTEKGLQSNHIRSVLQDSEGNIWIGTKVGGMLSKFNRNTQEFEHYKPNPSNPGSLNDDFILSLAEGEPGYLWVGTLYGGLNYFNKRTGRFTALKYSPDHPEGLMSNLIMAICKDDQGNIWIGHSEKGIDVYNPKTGKFTHFVSSSSGLSDNRIRVIYQDRLKNIWVGTYNGLNLYNPITKTFRPFLNNASDHSSISDNNIYCIWQDEKQNLWIGTSNSFDLYNYRTHTFTCFNKDNGFPANSARKIFDDRKGNLWISTDNGLIRFDPVKKEFRKYTREDGLNSNEFAMYAGCKLKNGELLFGTDYGFVLFNPEAISDNFVKPSVVLTDFKLFNQSVPVAVKGSPLETTISRAKEIKLTYRQSVMTFVFSALNFSSPEKARYAYKMEGFDNDWNEVGNKREATYTNLSPGTYVFHVKASNNDGIWNEQGTSVRIRILPPPWRTWWAYLLYVILTGFIIIKLRNRTIQRIHEEKAHEMDQMKLKLFLNVSHEFRTPLTLMLHPLEKIGSSENVDEIHSNADVVKLSSQKLLNLVNQLLDFRKVDLGKSVLKVSRHDMVSFTGEIVDLFKDLAIVRDLKLKFESPLTELDAWIDPDKYEKIINNLLSNAFKFTEPGGKIFVTLNRIDVNPDDTIVSRIIKSNPKSFFEIQVSDTGIGMSAEELKNIFNRFYQVDHLKAGTGIGLNYAKSLAELHGGEIRVESEPGIGSTFIVRIPLGNRYFTPDQIADETKQNRNPDTNAVNSLRYDMENMDYFAIEGEDNGMEDETEERCKQVILIVEDNKTLRRQIHEQLGEIYIVKEAANGAEGLEKTQKYLPDLIISDIMMPRMDGIELCRRIKTDMNTSHIPVILLTAKSTVENRIEGFETGADEYISKPFSMSLLEVRIKNLLLNKAKLKEKYGSSRILEPAKEYTTNNLDEAFLEKSMQIVMENIGNTDFSLTELREKMGMSRSNLFNKIQSLTGQNPSNFVRTIRLKYAARLLVQNNSSVKDICYQCGFNSPAYFIKTFKELYGQTPKEYVEATGK